MRTLPRLGPHANYADVVSLETAAGTRVELMRTCYHTQSFARHTHDYFTLGVVLRGSGSLWFRGADRTLRLGDVVVIPPGEVHTGELGPHADVLSYFAVHIPAEVLSVSADAEGLRGGRVPDFARATIRDNVLGAELRRLDSAMQAPCIGRTNGMAGTTDDGAANEALNAAIGQLVRRRAGAPQPRALTSAIREPVFVRTVREIITECYADSAQTSLRALALHAGVTPCHLVRVFTQTVGMSPHRYLVQTRVRHACQFLARGIPSSFVAAMTGFVDQSHLTTQFKRYVGTTPASYQRGLAASASRWEFREPVVSI